MLWPPPVKMSHSFIQNCCWMTASFASWRMKDLCQKWKVKLIFRGALNSLMAWPDWSWSPPPYFTTDLRRCERHVWRDLGLVLLALGVLDGQISSRLLQYDLMPLQQVLLLVVERVQLTARWPQLFGQPASTQTTHPPVALPATGDWGTYPYSTLCL